MFAFYATSFPRLSGLDWVCSASLWQVLGCREPACRALDLNSPLLFLLWALSEAVGKLSMLLAGMQSCTVAALFSGGVLSCRMFGVMFFMFLFGCLFLALLFSLFYVRCFGELFARHPLEKSVEKLGKADSIDALRLAIMAELDAISFYTQVARSVGDEKLRKVFLDIAREEKNPCGGVSWLASRNGSRAG